MKHAVTALACLAAVATAARAEPSPKKATPAATPAPSGDPTVATQASRPTPADADAFVANVNARLKALRARSDMAEFIKSTYITPDSERLAASLNEEVMAYLSEVIPQTVAFSGLPLSPETARALMLLRTASTTPAPRDPAGRAELATLGARLEGAYGKAKWCGDAPNPDPKTCRDLGELSNALATRRDWDGLLEAWRGWHATAAPQRADYERLVSRVNEGAREIGFADASELWKAGYDMPPAAFEAEVDRLWEQVRPLYDRLHCHARARLATVHGEARVPARRPIPAHILGNMWAQEWSNLYPLLAPHKGVGNLDVTAGLKRRRVDARGVMKLSEAFFTSLGLPTLPASFWERSLLVKPRDREVVCHASAWDVGSEGDVRVKMCIEPDEENLVTAHHELGHIYYYLAYNHLPVLFQSGANDGFHEAIGDAIVLSMTPDYLRDVGLIGKIPADPRATLNVLMKRALDKVAFLPFGLLVDKWRWDVFSGRVGPDRYNAHWWDLRARYQGVAPPVARTEADFDPAAKYHIAGNVPYMRYFLATILQYQMHRALCQAIGHTGPLHTCSIHGNKEAGARLQAMLALGASRPWPDALEALTGSRTMDASAIVDYFAPLSAWLDTEYPAAACGWEGGAPAAPSSAPR